jgi:hypothetical protein
VHHRDVGAAPRLFARAVSDWELLRLDFAIFALPVALAISDCVIPVSRSNTIWIRCWIFGFFSRLSARCNRLTWPALHLTICASAPNQMVSSESHFECCVDYHFASETNSQLSIQVALELVLEENPPSPGKNASNETTVMFRDLGFNTVSACAPCVLHPDEGIAMTPVKCFQPVG